MPPFRSLRTVARACTWRRFVVAVLVGWLAYSDGIIPLGADEPRQVELDLVVDKLDLGNRVVLLSESDALLAIKAADCADAGLETNNVTSDADWIGIGHIRGFISSSVESSFLRVSVSVDPADMREQMFSLANRPDVPAPDRLGATSFRSLYAASYEPSERANIATDNVLTLPSGIQAHATVATDSQTYFDVHKSIVPASLYAGAGRVTFLDQLGAFGTTLDGFVLRSDPSLDFHQRWDAAPYLHGVAFVPSTMTIYLEDRGVRSRLQSFKVNPGPFSIRQNALAGYHHLVAELLGIDGSRRTYRWKSAYFPQILAPGFTPFSLGVGKVSGREVQAASIRVGSSPWVTPGFSIASTPGASAFAAGANVASAWAVGSATVTRANGPGAGSSFDLAASFSAPIGVFSAEAQHTTAGYGPVLGGSPSTYATTAYRLSEASNVRHIGSLFVNATDTVGGPDSNLTLGANLLIPLHFGALSIGASTSRGRLSTDRSTSFFIGFGMTKGRVSATVQTDGSTQANGTKTTTSESLSYAISNQSAASFTSSSLIKSISYSDRNALLDVQAFASTASHPTVNVQGALGYIPGGGVHGMAPTDAFAEVRVGAPGVPVYVNGVYSGKSNASGSVTVGNLLTLVPNIIRIDDNQLPAEYTVRTNVVRVVPLAGDGIVVDFHAHKQFQVTATLVKDGGSGRPQPIGFAPILLSGPATLNLVSDGDGYVVIQDPPLGEYQISAGTAHCVPSITIATTMSRDLGTLVCRDEE